MEKIETKIPDVYILEPHVFGDHRGYFMETYSTAAFEALGITDVFVQDNQSFTAQKGTLRGIHVQNAPMAQAKLVRCISGRVMDFAVDLRKNSPTFLKYVGVELSAENKKQLYLPRGFAHGVISLEDNSTIEYLADNPYSPENDRSIRYNDPDIAIDWGMNEVILSEKDRNAPLYSDCDCNF